MHGDTLVEQYDRRAFAKLLDRWSDVTGWISFLVAKSSPQDNKKGNVRRAYDVFLGATPNSHKGALREEVTFQAAPLT